MENVNIFNLSKEWFAYVAENRNVKSNHSNLYFFILNKWNLLFWKQQFGLPTENTMQCLNILSYKTYIKTLLDLNDFGFIKIIERSKNQNTANIIEVVNNTKAEVKANTKALIKADAKASPKQVQSEDQSIVSIIKLLNKETIKLLNNKKNSDLVNKHLNYWLTLKPPSEDIPTTEIYPTFEDFWNLYDKKRGKTIVQPIWNKLKQKEKEDIMLNIIPYKKSLSQKKYQKDPSTYLRQRAWEDEIIIDNKNSNNYDTTAIREFYPDL